MISKEMSAKEMFEELGYHKAYTGDKNYIEFINNEPEVTIIISNISKSIQKVNIKNDLSVSFEEIKAIQKQIEELGWNNDK